MASEGKTGVIKQLLILALSEMEIDVCHLNLVNELCLTAIAEL